MTLLTLSLERPLYEGNPSKSWTFVITQDFVSEILWVFFMMCSYTSWKHFEQIWLESRT